MINFLSKLNWPDAFLGAILGIILGTLIPFIIKRIYYKFKKDKNFTLMGEWFSYNLTYREENIQIAEYEWRFKRNLINGKYIAAGQSLIDPLIQYNGELEISNDYLYLWGKGKHHDENVTWIFRRIFPYNKEDSMSGVFLGLDYDKFPFSGLSLISRVKITHENLETLLFSKIVKYSLSKKSNIEFLIAPLKH